MNLTKVEVAKQTSLGFRELEFRASPQRQEISYVLYSLISCEKKIYAEVCFSER